MAKTYNIFADEGADFVDQVGIDVAVTAADTAVMAFSAGLSDPTELTGNATLVPSFNLGGPIVEIDLPRDRLAELPLDRSGLVTMLGSTAYIESGRYVVEVTSEARVSRVLQGSIFIAPRLAL